MVVEVEDLEEMRKFHMVRSKLVMAKVYTGHKQSDNIGKNKTDGASN